MPNPAPDPDNAARLEHVLPRACTLALSESTSKKRVLERASELIAAHCEGVDAGELFEALLARERLGTTAIGEGVALPHCRLHQCEQPLGLLMTLASPVAFQAPDDGAVDIVFVLVVPREATEAHLALLSMLASGFSDPGYRRRLRDAQDDEKLYAAALALPESM